MHADDGNFVPKIDLTQSVRMLASTRKAPLDLPDRANADQQHVDDFREQLRASFKKKFGHEHQNIEKSKEEKLQLFLKGYKASVGKEEQVVVDQEHIESELRKELEIMTEETRDVAHEFHLAKCEATSLEILPPLFQQPSGGLCATYLVTEKQAVALLNNQLDPVPLGEIASAFGASYLKPQPDAPEKARDVVGNLEKLVDAATSGAVLDFEAKETVAVFFELGLILVFGMKRTIVYTVDQMISKVEELPKDRASIVALQSALMRAKSSPKRKTPMKYVVDILVSLALDAQLSVFFRYLADAVVFKRKYYYADADIFTYRTCQQIADLAERIEALDFVGYKNFQVPSPAVIPNLQHMEMRVAFTIKEHLAVVRTAFIEHEDIEKVPTLNLIESAKLFVDCLVTLDNGQAAPIVGLWDLFRAIDACKCQHKRFPLYKKLCSEVGSKVTIMSDTKALKMIHRLYKNNLVPFVFIFLAQAPDVPFRGFYWKTMNSCLRLANAFKPLASIVVDIDKEAFLGPLRVALAL